MSYVVLGGETIREINRQSGAHVELDRNPPPNPGEKIFNVRGNPQQIQHAIQLICEKAGLQSDVSSISHQPFIIYRDAICQRYYPYRAEQIVITG